jgi:hypothetical protein
MQADGEKDATGKGIVCSSHIRRVVGCPVWAELWLWWRVKVCLEGCVDPDIGRRYRDIQRRRS